MTHTSTEQPEALQLAKELRECEPSKLMELKAANALIALHARVQELEASQAQRVPLSDEQISDLNMQAWKGGGNATEKLARLVERALGITQEKQG